MRCVCRGVEGLPWRSAQGFVCGAHSPLVRSIVQLICCAIAQQIRLARGRWLPRLPQGAARYSCGLQPLEPAIADCSWLAGRLGAARFWTSHKLKIESCDLAAPDSSSTTMISIKLFLAPNNCPFRRAALLTASWIHGKRTATVVGEGRALQPNPVLVWRE